MGNDSQNVRFGVRQQRDRTNATMTMARKMTTAVHTVRFQKVEESTA